MQIDPPPSEARRFPVSALVSLAAITLSILMWTGTNVDALVATRDTVARAPWTLLTSTFIHLDPLHLLFNLSWWWPFACRIEYAWGKMRLICITLLLAIISGAAQIALSNPGVGLSGVVYGVFSLIAVVHHTHPAFRGLISRRVIWIMAGWFVLCVVLSVLNVWKVGNVAHGAGAAAGYLLGRCILASPRTRAPWIVALTALGLLSVAGNFVTLPRFSSHVSAYESASLGTDAYKKGDYKEAARLLELAHKADPNDARITYNLGLAYQRQSRDDDALKVYHQGAAKSSDLRAEFGIAIVSILDRHAADAATPDVTTNLSSGYKEAAALLEHVHRDDPSDTRITYSLGRTYQSLSRHNEALDLYREAAGNDPALHDQLAPAIASILIHQAYDQAQSENYAAAHERITEALQWQPDDAYAQRLLKSIQKSLSAPPH